MKVPPWAWILACTYVHAFSITTSASGSSLTDVVDPTTRTAFIAADANAFSSLKTSVGFNSRELEVITCQHIGNACNSTSLLPLLPSGGSFRAYNTRVLWPVNGNVTNLVFTTCYRHIQRASLHSTLPGSYTIGNATSGFSVYDSNSNAVWTATSTVADSCPTRTRRVTLQISPGLVLAIDVGAVVGPSSGALLLAQINAPVPRLDYERSATHGGVRIQHAGQVLIHAGASQMVWYTPVTKFYGTMGSSTSTEEPTTWTTIPPTTGPYFEETQVSGMISTNAGPGSNITGQDITLSTVHRTFGSASSSQDNSLPFSPSTVVEHSSRDTKLIATIGTVAGLVLLCAILDAFRGEFFKWILMLFTWALTSFILNVLVWTATITLLLIGLHINYIVFGFNKHYVRRTGCPLMFEFRSWCVYPGAQHVITSRRWPLYMSRSRGPLVRIFLGAPEVFLAQVLACTFTKLMYPGNPTSSFAEVKAVEVELDFTDRSGQSRLKKFKVDVRAYFPSAERGRSWMVASAGDLIDPTTMGGEITSMAVYLPADAKALDIDPLNPVFSTQETALHKLSHAAPTDLIKPTSVPGKLYFRVLPACLLALLIMFLGAVTYASANPLPSYTSETVRSWVNPSLSPCASVPAGTIIGNAVGGNYSLSGIPLSLPGDPPCLWASGANPGEYLYVILSPGLTPLTLANHRFGLTVDDKVNIHLHASCQDSGMVGPPYVALETNNPHETPTCYGKHQTYTVAQAYQMCDSFVMTDGEINLATLFRSGTGYPGLANGGSVCISGKPEDSYVMLSDIVPTVLPQRVNVVAYYMTPATFQEVDVTVPTASQDVGITGNTLVTYCGLKDVNGNCVETAYSVIHHSDALPSGSEADLRKIGGVPIPPAAAPAVLAAIGLSAPVARKAHKSAEYWGSYAEPYGQKPNFLSSFGGCSAFNGDTSVATKVNVSVAVRATGSTQCNGIAIVPPFGVGYVHVWCSTEIKTTAKASARARTTVNVTNYALASNVGVQLPVPPSMASTSYPTDLFSASITISPQCGALSVGSSFPLGVGQFLDANSRYESGLYHPPLVSPPGCSGGTNFVPSTTTGLEPGALTGDWLGCNPDGIHVAYVCGVDNTGQLYYCWAPVWGGFAVGADEATSLGWSEAVATGLGDGAMCSAGPAQPLSINGPHRLQFDYPMKNPTRPAIQTWPSACALSYGFNQQSPYPQGSFTVSVPGIVKVSDTPCTPEPFSASVVNFGGSWDVTLTWQTGGVQSVDVTVDGAHLTAFCSNGFVSWTATKDPTGQSVSIAIGSRSYHVSLPAAAASIPAAPAPVPANQTSHNSGQSTSSTVVTRHVVNVTETRVTVSGSDGFDSGLGDFLDLPGKLFSDASSGLSLGHLSTKLRDAISTIAWVAALMLLIYVLWTAGSWLLFSRKFKRN